MIGPSSNRIASIDASWPFMPLSMLCAAPSTTMMASSTTMPIASTMANKVAKFTVKPIAAMAAKAPMIVTGTVVAGTSMARQSCRKIRMTMSTRIAASISVLYTSCIEALTKIVTSNGTSYCTPCGKLPASSASRFFTSLATVRALAPGDSEMPRPADALLSTLKMTP